MARRSPAPRNQGHRDDAAAAQVRPSESILEIDAGADYNAAPPRHLIGNSGHITTLDVDEGLIAGAHAQRTAAGITKVTTLTRGGALDHASFTTAGEHDGARRTVRTPNRSGCDPLE